MLAIRAIKMHGHKIELSENIKGKPVFPAIEAIVFADGTTKKEEVRQQLNQLFNEDFDPELLEIVYDGLTEKYESELYGIEFANMAESVAFFAKALNTLKVI